MPRFLRRSLGGRSLTHDVELRAPAFFIMPELPLCFVHRSSTDLEGELADPFLETRKSGMVALSLQRRLADGARRHAALHERVAGIGARSTRAGRSRLLFLDAKRANVRQAAIQ